MNETLTVISSVAGAVALIIAILSIVLRGKEKTQLTADLVKVRDELTRRASLQEDQSKNTSQEFRLLLNQQHDLASASQRDKLLQTENYLLDKFDKSVKEKLVAVETALKSAMAKLETQQHALNKNWAELAQQIEQLTKEQQELKLRSDSLTKFQGDVNRQLIGLQIDLPSLKEQVKTLETNEADTNIRFSMVPSKLEQIEQWRQAEEVARPKLDKLVADLRLLRDLTLKHGETTEKSLVDFKQLVDGISAKNEIALRSTMLDKFWSLMDSEQERKTAALKFIKEIDEEENFVQMCLEFPSQASINALQGLASESDKKDITVEPLYKLSEQKLEAGLIDEARTLFLQLTEIKDLPGETMLRIFSKLAQICKEQQDSEYADVILNRLRAIQKDFTPEQKLIAAEILNQLTALFESVSGNKGKLESVYKRLHESYVASGQVDQGETARNLKKLADLYFDEERYEEAEPSYVRAFSILSKLLAADDPILKQILQNLARICEMQKRPEESEKYQLQLLQMLTARKDEDGLLAVVASLSNSASAYAARDDYEHAENLLNKCITALQKIKGSDDEKTRETVALLEKICHHSEDKEELKRIYKRQLEATRHERSKSAYHARTALKLATLYAGEGEYSQADSLFKSVEHMLSSDKDTARLIDELAKIYSSLARYDLAEVTFNKALEMRETFAHEESNELIASYANLGASYAVQKDYQMAEMMYKRELECAEEYFGGDSENVITPLMHLAGCFIISGRLADAEPCYKRILETRYKTQGEGHADLIDSMLHLAELYRIQKNFTEAEIFYESACELAEQVHGESSLKVAEILDKRALLAKLAEQLDAAQELQARAAAIRQGAEKEKSMKSVHVLNNG